MPLDIAFGIFIALGAAEYFNVELSGGILLFSIASALLPDIDMPLASRAGKIDRLARLLGGHRGFLHNPLIYIFLAILVYAVAGSFWAAIFSAGVLWHFIHDTFFLGWGVGWLWPISARRIKFFPDKDGRITRTPILTWLPEEEQKIRAEWGTKHWIRDFYFRPSVISIFEYGGFLVAMILLATALK